MEVRNLQKDAGSECATRMFVRWCFPPSFPRFQLFASYVLSILLLRVVLSIIQMRELPKMTWSSQTWFGECLVGVQYTHKIAHQNISWKCHIIPSFKNPWIHIFHLHLKILYFIHDSENTMIPVTHQWLSNIPRYPKSLRHPAPPSINLRSLSRLVSSSGPWSEGGPCAKLFASAGIHFFGISSENWRWWWWFFEFLSIATWFGMHLIWMVSFFEPFSFQFGHDASGLIEPNPPLHPERKTGETMGAPQSSPET